MKFTTIELSLAAVACSLFGPVFTYQAFLTRLDRNPNSSTFGSVFTCPGIPTDQVAPANAAQDVHFGVAAQRTAVTSGSLP